MLFNSYVFVGFFVLVYVIYLLLSRQYKAQNVLLLIASYIFYAFFDWRFLFLLIACTVINFFAAKGISRNANRLSKNYLLGVTVAINLAILGFFKYFNFFTESFTDVLGLVGISANSVVLKIVLPLGISFYIFRVIGYVVDVYREKLSPAKRFIDFSLFVAFFTQLIAGPIERGANLLPQIASPRRITAALVNTAIFLILWGYFKKMVIADNLGLITDQIFNGYMQYGGMDIVIAILAFTVQIYCDFSGYTDIARGLSKLMGFELMLNFRLPYFAMNPRDFWAQWHISLSTWLRDYLYIPLGGNRKGKAKTLLNLKLTMLLGGLWHGAGWTFIIWGGYHGFLLIVHRLFAKVWRSLPQRDGRYFYLSNWVQMLLMFVLVSLGWLIFRCSSIDQLSYMIAHLGLQLSSHSLSLVILCCISACHWFWFSSTSILLMTCWQFQSSATGFALRYIASY